MIRNITIANTHRIYRKLVGELVGQGAMVALIGNTIAVPFGVIVFAVGVVGSANLWMLGLTLLVSFVIGVILAILADSQTLAGCARWRINNEQIAVIREKYAVIPEEERHPSLADLEQKEIKSQEHARTWNMVCVTFSSTVSACAGILFWHWLLSALPEWMAWVFSTLFAVLVSFTLISCELLKRQNNEIVRESIVADHYTNEAMSEDAQEAIVDAMGKQCRTQVKELTESDVVAVAVEEFVISELDRQLAGGRGQIPLRIEREKEDKRIAAERDQEKLSQQLRLIQGGKQPNDPTTGPLAIAIVGETTRERIADAKQKYPSASSREIASMLNVSQSVVQYHCKRLDTLSKQAE